MSINPQVPLTENQLSKLILDAAFKVHTTTVPGLLESVYEATLAYELRKAGLQVERQVPIPIRYEELTFDEGFRADLLVEGKVIVELKSVVIVASVCSSTLARSASRTASNASPTECRTSELDCWISFILSLRPSRSLREVSLQAVLKRRSTTLISRSRMKPTMPMVRIHRMICS